MEDAAEEWRGMFWVAIGAASDYGRLEIKQWGVAQGNRLPRFGGNTGVCGGRRNGARGLPLEWASDPGRHQQLWQYGED